MVDLGLRFIGWEVYKIRAVRSSRSTFSRWLLRCLIPRFCGDCIVTRRDGAGVHPFPIHQIFPHRQQVTLESVLILK
jgi:hypothetical protein